MAASTTTLAWGAVVFKQGYEAAGSMDRFLDVLRWPLNYFLKCWDEQNQVFYGQVS